MSDFFKRITSAGSAKSSLLSQSKYLGDDEFIDTGYPLLNLALSGKVDGGLSSGLTIFAGPSKNFKSNYLCMCMAAFQKANPDGLILFYDTEFGTKESYLDSFGIDRERVEHILITDIEEMKFDMVQKLKACEEGNPVMMAVDSFGNVASKKEVDDALNENSAADMTRAKQLKSLGRMITPHLSLKKIPCVAVNHTYKTQETYSKDVMSGGTGLEYSSDTILFVGRSQEKDGKDLAGFKFTLKAAKSRYVKENSKFPILVTFEGGVSRMSGMFDLMLEHTDLVTQKGAWYEVKGEDKNKRRVQIENDDDFMNALLENELFVNAVESKYLLPVPGGPTVESVLEDAEDEKYDPNNPLDGMDL